MDDPQAYIDAFKVVKEGFSAGREIIAFGKDVAPAMRRGFELINKRLLRQREEAAADTLLEVPPILERRQVTEPIDPPPKFMIPWFEGASNDTAPELRDLWARLMAAAMDPTRKDRVRLSFIETVKEFDPLDTLVLQRRFDTPGQLQPNTRDFLADSLQRSTDEIQISLDNLLGLRRLGPGAVFWLAPYGKELVRACRD